MIDTISSVTKGGTLLCVGYAHVKLHKKFSKSNFAVSNFPFGFVVLDAEGYCNESFGTCQAVIGEALCV